MWPDLFSSFGFLCLPLSTHVIYTFHQIHLYSVICGHFGIILLLNLEFGGGVRRSGSLSINCPACSYPKQTGLSAFSLGLLSFTLFSHNPVSLFSYPQEYLHLREDEWCDPSPPTKHRIKLRCATTFQKDISLKNPHCYPLSLFFQEVEEGEPLKRICYLQSDQTRFGVCNEL